MFDDMNKNREIMKKLSDMLRTTEEYAVQKLDSFLVQQKKLEAKLTELRNQLQENIIENLKNSNNDKV